MDPTFIANDTELVILQHPTETKKPLGSAKILQLSLANCTVFIGENFTESNELNQLLAQDDYQNWLLYPNATSQCLSKLIKTVGMIKTSGTVNTIGAARAIDLVNISEEEKAQLSVDLSMENPKKQRLILIDGTWKKAYKIWQLSHNLSHIPCAHLPQDICGNYRVRKAPSKQHLSTLEAGFHALSLLEPQQDFSSLLRTFEQMIDFHIAQMPAAVFERNYLK